MALARAVLSLAATACAWVPLRRPTAVTRLRVLPKTQATNADWRTRCDTEGVVSHYDFGIRLGGDAAPAPAETAVAPTYLRVSFAA